MKEMSKKLQEQLWGEATSFVENSGRKHLARFGVTLDGVDNHYLELSFTCPCNDEDFDDFLAIIDNEFLQTIRFEYSNVRIQEFACISQLKCALIGMTGDILCNLVLGMKVLHCLISLLTGRLSMKK